MSDALTVPPPPPRCGSASAPVAQHVRRPAPSSSATVRFRARCGLCTRRPCRRGRNALDLVTGDGRGGGSEGVAEEPSRDSPSFGWNVKVAFPAPDGDAFPISGASPGVVRDGFIGSLRNRSWGVVGGPQRVVCVRRRHRSPFFDSSGIAGRVRPSCDRSGRHRGLAKGTPIIPGHAANASTFPKIRGRLSKYAIGLRPSLCSPLVPKRASYFTRPGVRHPQTPGS